MSEELLKEMAQSIIDGDSDLSAELAKKADVKQLALFHFSAAVYKTVAERQEAETEARAIFPNTIASIDGMELEV